MLFILWSLGGTICKVLYSFVALIDYYVYGLAGTCFDLIRNIYEYSFFGNATDLINNIRRNIYIVLGVLMVFKIILSAIQYMINPDTFDDKEKGMVGILKNAIITVLLIAFMPVVFDFAMDIQADIVGAIPNIIFGNSIEIEYPEVDENGVPTNSGKVTKITPTDSTSGQAVAYAVLRSFISVSPNKENWVTPGTNSKEWNEGHRTTSIGPYIRTIPGDALKICSKETASGESVIDEDCYKEENFDFTEIHDLASFKNHIADGMEKGLDKSEYNYMVLISTAGGVFLVYLLLSMSLDIAIRTIKLGIIQMLAPIPISSYMFKKDNFNKFMTISGKVYADLFVRMAIVFIVILVVQILVASGILNPANNVSGDNWLQDLLRNVILIFGLFMFAKTAPKFVTDLLGLPDISGGDIAAMFKRAGAMAGSTGAMATAGFSNFKASKGKNAGERLRSTIAGMSSAKFRGMRAAYNGKGMKEAFKTGHEGAKQARINRGIDEQQDIHFKDRMRARYNEFTGVVTKGNIAQKRLEALERTEKNMSATKALDNKLLDKFGDYVNVNAAGSGKANKDALASIGADLSQVINQQIASNSTWNAAAHSGFQSLIRRTTDATQKANLRNIQTRMSAGAATAADIEYLRSNFSGTDLNNILASGTQKVDSNLMRISTALSTPGAAVSYSDIRAIQMAAEADTTGSMKSLAVKLNASSQQMRAIQKEQFDRIEKGDVRDLSGNVFADITNDADYQAQRQQNIRDLEQDSIYLVDSDPTRSVAGATSKADLLAKMHGGLNGFATEVTKQVGNTREELHTDAEAKAQASLERRRSNKQQNGGGKP